MAIIRMNTLVNNQSRLSLFRFNFKNLFKASRFLGFHLVILLTPPFSLAMEKENNHRYPVPLPSDAFPQTLEAMLQNRLDLGSAPANRFVSPATVKPPKQKPPHTTVVKGPPPKRPPPRRPLLTGTTTGASLATTSPKSASYEQRRAPSRPAPPPPPQASAVVHNHGKELPQNQAQTTVARISGSRKKPPIADKPLYVMEAKNILQKPVPLPTGFMADFIGKADHFLLSRLLFPSLYFRPATAARIPQSAPPPTYITKGQSLQLEKSALLWQMIRRFGDELETYSVGSSVTIDILAGALSEFSLHVARVANCSNKDQLLSLADEFSQPDSRLISTPGEMLPLAKWAEHFRNDRRLIVMKQPANWANLPLFKAEIKRFDRCFKAISKRYSDLDVAVQTSRKESVIFSCITVNHMKDFFPIEYERNASEEMSWKWLSSMKLTQKNQRIYLGTKPAPILLLPAGLRNSFADAIYRTLFEKNPSRALAHFRIDYQLLLAPFTTDDLNRHVLDIMTTVLALVTTQSPSLLRDCPYADLNPAYLLSPEKLTKRLAIGRDITENHKQPQITAETSYSIGRDQITVKPSSHDLAEQVKRIHQQAMMEFSQQLNANDH